LSWWDCRYNGVRLVTLSLSPLKHGKGVASGHALVICLYIQLVYHIEREQRTRSGDLYLERFHQVSRILLGLPP
jgi:hypothetical protein